MTSFQPIDCKVLSSLALCLFFLAFPTFSLDEASQQQMVALFTQQSQSNSTWQTFSADDFSKWLNADIMERVSQPVQIIKTTNTAMTFSVQYTFPNTGETEMADLQFIPLLPNQQDHFTQNLALAILTGEYKQDSINLDKQRTFDFDQQKKIAQIHRYNLIDRPIQAFYIQEFYEMQELPPSDQNSKHVTILITRPAIQTFLNPVFKPTYHNNELEKNTKKLMEYIYEISLALSYCQEFGILHGDIRPENIVMVRDYENPETLLPALSNFESALFRDNNLSPEQINNYDPKLRYFNSNYRMPSIQSLKDNNSGYYYSDDFREDSYALAATIRRILQINNGTFFPGTNPMRGLKAFLDHILDPETFSLYKIPPPSEFINIIMNIKGNKPIPENYIKNTIMKTTYLHKDLPGRLILDRILLI